MNSRLTSDVSGFLAGFSADICEPDNKHAGGIKQIAPICRVCRGLFRDRELQGNRISRNCADLQTHAAHSIGLE